MTFLSWWRGEATPVSDRWLQEQKRREERIEFHSPRIRFPIKKILDAHPLWNKHKMQQRRVR